MPVPPAETRLRLRMTGGTPASPPSGRVPSIDDYIEVWWAGDRVFYRGTVTSFNKETNEHRILYDDGESGIYDMTKESWRLLRSATSGQAAHKGSTAGYAPSKTAERSKELSNVRQDNGRPQAELAEPPRVDSRSAAMEVDDDVNPVTAAESARDADGQDAAARVPDEAKSNVPAVLGPASPRLPERAHQGLNTNSKKPEEHHQMLHMGIDERGLRAMSDLKRVQKGKGGRKSVTKGRGAKSGKGGRMGTVSADESGCAPSTGTGENDSRTTAVPSLEGTGAIVPSTRERSSVGSLNGQTKDHSGDGLGSRYEPNDKAAEIPPAKNLDVREARDSLVLEQNQCNTQNQRNTQIPDGSDLRAREPFLPFDHVMTAVVQTTVMMLDERLKPICERIDDLSSVMRQSDTHSVSEVLRESHAKCFQDIDETRKEIKRLRTEHRAVIAEAIAVKEGELRCSFELSLNRAVNELSSYVQSALTGAANAAAAAAISAAFREAPRNELPTDALAAPLMGPSATDPSRLGQSAVEGKRQRGPSESRSAFENSPVHVPSGSQAYSAETLRDCIDPQGLQQYPLSSRTHQGCDESILLLKQRALEIAARQVTVWLLETQHECNQPSERARWVSETTTRCATDVSENLRRFDNPQQAIETLASTLGDDNVELGWILQSPSLDNLRLARRNYAAWEPPPSDSEWVLEQHLLRRLSEQFNWAIAKQQVTLERNEVALAVEAARIVMECTSPGPSTTHRRVTRNPMYTASGSAARSGVSFEAQGSGMRMGTAEATGGQQVLAGIAGPSHGGTGIPSVPNAYATSCSLQGPSGGMPESNTACQNDSRGPPSSLVDK